MFCDNCGTQLPDDAVFCPSCGKEIGTNNNVPRNEKQIAHNQDIPIRNINSAQLKWIVGILLVVVILFGVFKFMNSPSMKVGKYLKKNDIESVIELYKETSDAKEIAKMETKAMKYVEDHVDKYIQEDNNESYEAIYEMVRDLRDTVLSDYYSEIDEKLLKMRDIYRAREYFENGEKYLAEEKYTRAIEEFRNVNDVDEKIYKLANEKIVAITALYKTKVIAMAKESANNNDYDNAIYLLKDSQYYLEDDEIAKLIDTYYLAKEEAEINQSIDNIQAYIDKAEYISAYSALDTAFYKYPDNSKFINLKNSLDNAYKKYCFQLMEEMMGNCEYDSILSLFDEMESHVNDDEVMQKKEHYVSIIPVSLFSLDIDDKKFSGNIYYGMYSCDYGNSMEDTYGNTYEEKHVASLKCGVGVGDYQNQVGGMLFYNNNDGFSKISGQFAYDKNGEKNGTVGFKIYADDNLVFDSGDINDNTKPSSFEADISGCRQFVIFWETKVEVKLGAWASTSDGMGSILLIDPILTK